MGAGTATRRAAGHYWLFLKMGIRSQTVYSFDSALLLVAVVFLNVVDLSLLGVILSRFSNLGGWTLWEVVLLYSLYLAALGVQNLFTLHLNLIDTYVRDGTLDQMLVRPVSPLVQMLGKEFHYRNLIHHLGTGLVGIVLAADRLGLTWTPGRLAILVLSILGGSAVLTGIVLGLSSLAFWTVESQVFGYGTLQLQEVVQHYPAHIFGTWFVRLVTFVLPFAFLNYYPVLALVGRAQQAGHPFLAYASPLAGVLAVAAGALVWRAGLRRYQSTGS